MWLRSILVVGLLCFGRSAFAESAVVAEAEADPVIEAVSIRETRLLVVPRSEARTAPPEADAPLSLGLPLHETSHRDGGLAYVDPFLGRVVYPELALRMTTAFAREINPGAATQRGPSALVSRVDLNLWAVDLRFSMSTSGPEVREPLDVVFKLPVSAGDHWFAPIVVFHMPLDVGPGESIYEAGLGYHGHFGPLGLKLEVTGFNGTPERTSGPDARGMIGWDGVVSLLVGERVGIVFEAEGTTVASEIGESGPRIGDSVVRLAPGLRFFPTGAGLELGFAGLITVASDSYSVLQRHGGIVSAGYTFF